MGPHQIKNLLQSKRNNKQNKEVTYKIEIFANYISQKVLIFKIYKEHVLLNSKTTTTTHTQIIQLKK